MLCKIEVKGFRSLRDFEMEITSGLNVLVGPNGAGKTNIILFFDFLRNLTSSPLSEAIGRAGGTAQVFAKRGKNSFSDLISINLEGVLNVGEVRHKYYLSVDLSFSQSRQDVFFNRQELKIDIFSDAAPNSRTSTYLHFLYEPVDGGSGQGVKLYRAITQTKGGRDWLRDEIKRLDERQFFASNCIVSLILYTNETLSTIAQDFSGRFILNVVPSHVKKPEDSTREPGIDSDGSGLSATLHAIKRRRPLTGMRSFSPFRRTHEMRSPEWKNVMDLIKVAVPSIEDVDVENDPFDNLLRCRIKVGKGNRSSIVPLSALSDGTVKWMSLVARLLTSREALLLEEPENYLHPLMQREVVRLLRDSVAHSSFMMVSTHSETLLNAVNPDELIIVSYEKGGTRAKRVSNANDVEQEINRTGFGLGYYYLADAVETES